MQVGKRYSVSIEICHVMSEEKANSLANEIRDRLNDLDRDVYICVGSYEQVRERELSLENAA